MSPTPLSNERNLANEPFTPVLGQFYHTFWCCWWWMSLWNGCLLVTTYSEVGYKTKQPSDCYQDADHNENLLQRRPSIPEPARLVTTNTPYQPHALVQLLTASTTGQFFIAVLVVSLSVEKTAKLPGICMEVPNPEQPCRSEILGLLWVWQG